MPSSAPLYLAFVFSGTSIVFAVFSDLARPLRRLGRAYQFYRVDDEIPSSYVSIELNRTANGYRLVTPWESRDFTDEGDLIRTNGQSPAARLLDASLEQVLINGLRHFLPNTECFHAAVVAFGNRGIVLAGLPFAGKTTLSLALCALGGRHITDDVLLLQENRAWPLVRRAAFRPRPDIFQMDAFADPDSRMDDTGEQFTAFVRSSFLASPNQPCSVSDILFLAPFQNETSLTPLSAVEGLATLSQFSFLPMEDDPASQRLFRYAQNLPGIHWWTFAPGRPVDAAQIIATRLELPTLSRQEADAA